MTRRTSRQAIEHSQGTPAPSDPARHYTVEPGHPDTGPEYFGDTLPGQTAAISRAAWLSVAHSPQRVLATHPADALRPACDRHPFKRFRGGTEIAPVNETGELIMSLHFNEQELQS